MILYNNNVLLPQIITFTNFGIRFIIAFFFEQQHMKSVICNQLQYVNHPNYKHYISTLF